MNYRNAMLTKVMNQILARPEIEPDQNGDITLDSALLTADAPPIECWGIRTFILNSDGGIVNVPRCGPILDLIECVSGNASEINLVVGEEVIQKGLINAWRYPLPLASLTYNTVTLVGSDPFSVRIRLRYCGCTITQGSTCVQIWNRSTCIPQVTDVEKIMSHAKSFYAFDGPWGPFKTEYGMLSDSTRTAIKQFWETHP